ncbi:6304_t:CDS:2, partial [Gigaspora rosea]
KSWEFERPIPEWLKRIHKHREDLDTAVDTTDLDPYSRVAETSGRFWPLQSRLKKITPPATEITTSNDIIKDEDAHHPDIPQRENSERDIDVIFKSHMFSCFDKIMDFRFGEIVSRASRQRHILAIGASDKAEGYHTDWLFTILPRGKNFSFCEKAGSKIENGRKILDNTFKVQKTLRDMHHSYGSKASEKNKNFKENVVIPQRIKENMTPKTKRTKRALEPSNVNNT